MESLGNIGFHESTLLSLDQNGKNLVLELEGVHVGREIRMVSVSLAGLRSISKDGTAVERLTPESQDSEVLTLQYTERSVVLILEISNFEAHISATQSYRFDRDSVQIRVHGSRLDSF